MLDPITMAYDGIPMSGGTRSLATPRGNTVRREGTKRSFLNPGKELEIDNLSSLTNWRTSLSYPFGANLDQTRVKVKTTQFGHSLFYDLQIYWVELSVPPDHESQHRLDWVTWPEPKNTLHKDLLVRRDNSEDEALQRGTQLILTVLLRLWALSNHEGCGPGSNLFGWNPLLIEFLNSSQILGKRETRCWASDCSKGAWPYTRDSQVECRKPWGNPKEFGHPLPQHGEWGIQELWIERF